MRNLSSFNDIYNIHNIRILAVIFEYHWQKIKNDNGFDLRCFTSANTLSGAIEQIKSKVILTFPRSVEIVDLMENLLSGGYSSVHTRLGFDTEMFAPKSKEYIEQIYNIIEKMKNVCGEPMKKKKEKTKQGTLRFVQKEDLKNKPIDKICLDGEQESKGRRVFNINI